LQEYCESSLGLPIVAKYPDFLQSLEWYCENNTGNLALYDDNEYDDDDEDQVNKVVKNVNGTSETNDTKDDNDDNRLPSTWFIKLPPNLKKFTSYIIDIGDRKPSEVLPTTLEELTLSGFEYGFVDEEVKENIDFMDYFIELLPASLKRLRIFPKGNLSNISDWSLLPSHVKYLTLPRPMYLY
jgi:hypothetical protein